MKYVFVFLTFGTLHAQRVITTIAGTDTTFAGDGKPAVQARLGWVRDLALAPDGVIYFSDPDNAMVMKVDRDGVLHVVAGNGIRGFSGDGGLAVEASLGGPNRPGIPQYPLGIDLDSQGNLYIVDFDRIRKVTPAGIITTVAGGGLIVGGEGIPAAQARINAPSDVAVDRAGNVYYSENSPHRIRKLDTNGLVTTYAGRGAPAFSGDGGLATLAELNFPTGLVFDPQSSLYIADRFNGRIRKVTLDGTISTLVAGLANPTGLSIDSTGNFYTIQPGFSPARLTRISPQGAIQDVTTLIVNVADFNGLASDPLGGIYTAFNSVLGIRRYIPEGETENIAGSGAFRFSGDGGPAIAALLHEPATVSIGRTGDLYVVDRRNCRIRSINPAGVIRTALGGGPCVVSGRSELYPPQLLLGAVHSVALGPNGEVFFSDFNRIYSRGAEPFVRGLVNADNIPGFSGDGGPAIDARTRSSPVGSGQDGLSFGSGMSVDAQGKLYFADISNHRIRRVADGIVETIAGSTEVAAAGPEPQGGFPSGFSGDGGPAKDAQLKWPSAVFVARSGNIYIQDTGNLRIRRITPDGIIRTVAGNGQRGPYVDGVPAVNAPLSIVRSAGIWVDVAENLYILEHSPDPNVRADRVRRVSPDGIIRTIAGNGAKAFSGDGGPAEAASFIPYGIAGDDTGNIYVSDIAGNRIRKILANPVMLAASPAELTFASRAGGVPPPIRAITVDASVPGVPFQAILASSADWLTVTPSTGASPRLVELLADPSRLTPGDYRATVVVTMPGANPAEIRIPVTFNVTAGVAPRLGVDKEELTFTYPRGAPARALPLTIRNTGDGSLDFNVTVEGQMPLSLSATNGRATPATAALVNVTASAGDLPPGTYKGRLVVASPTTGESRTIPVTMTLSGKDKAVLLSQTGLTFTAVAGGGVIPPQSFAVVSLGASPIAWSTAVSTLSGGDWLAGVRSIDDMEVRIDASRLAPGVYYGQVRVDSDGAANTPQVITAFLDVLSPDADPGAEAQPNELVFTGVASGVSPGSKEVLVYNRVATAKIMRVVATTENARNWIAHLPGDATVTPDAPTRVVVQPFIEGLATGVHRGTLGLQFSDGRVRNIGVTLILTSAVTTASRSADAACAPTKLVAAITTLGPAFNVSASYPVALEVNVRDDCGQPLDAGKVVATFTNGDPALTMQSLRDGRWQGTWVTGARPSQQVTVKVEAENPPQTIKGVREVTGDLRSAREKPVFTANGVINAFGSDSYAPLAPGEVISIFGQRLSEGQAAADRVPIPLQLASTEAYIAGRQMPMFFASDGQLNAMLPFDLEPNTRHTMVVRRGAAQSDVVGVNVAEAQPAVLPAGGRVKAGDTLVLYCLGLGAVDAPVVAGEGAPLSPLANALKPVRVTIGGREAQVAFAGLAPNYVGLYQVNAIVPEGVTKGSAVPVVVTVAGQASREVNVAVE